MRIPAGMGTLAATAVVVGALSYLVGDLFDVLPGRLTLAPVPNPPEPFPTAPGAVGATEVAAATGLLDAAAPAPRAADLDELVRDLGRDERMGPSVGVVVADSGSGAVLASHEANGSKTPASTTKILTGLAALGRLGTDARLATTAVRGAASGEIVLVGAGDMMLAPDAGDPGAVYGRAGLGDLARATARELRLAGQSSVTLAFDDTLFSGPSLHPTWSDSFFNNGFVAPVAALAVDIGARRTDVEYPPRHADPARRAAEVFAEALEAAGVAVEGTPRRAAAPANPQVLASVESATVRELTAYMLHTSDNTIAEVLGRLAAIEVGLPGSFEGAAQALLTSVQDLGVDTTGTRLVDASGLSDTAGIPARVLADVLTSLDDADGDWPGLRELSVDLPVAALQGTVADRFIQAVGAGVVRAKTGSLPGVTSLAGTVLTADDRLLVFVVMADQTPPGGQVAPRRAIDGFVDQLALCGCRGEEGTGDEESGGEDAGAEDAGTER